MFLEQVGVFLLDRRATVVGLSRLVSVLRVRRPERADRFGVGGVEGLDELVGRRADRLLVGIAVRRILGGRRGGRSGRLDRTGPRDETPPATTASAIANNRPTGIADWNGLSCFLIRRSPDLANKQAPARRKQGGTSKPGVGGPSVADLARFATAHQPSAILSDPTGSSRNHARSFRHPTTVARRHCMRPRSKGQIRAERTERTQQFSGRIARCLGRGCDRKIRLEEHDRQLAPADGHVAGLAHYDADPVGTKDRRRAFKNGSRSV